MSFHAGAIGVTDAPLNRAVERYHGETLGALGVTTSAVRRSTRADMQTIFAPSPVRGGVRAEYRRPARCGPGLARPVSPISRSAPDSWSVGASQAAMRMHSRIATARELCDELGEDLSRRNRGRLRPQRHHFGANRRIRPLPVLSKGLTGVFCLVPRADDASGTKHSSTIRARRFLHPQLHGNPLAYAAALPSGHFRERRRAGAQSRHGRAMGRPARASRHRSWGRRQRG